MQKPRIRFTRAKYALVAGIVFAAMATFGISVAQASTLTVCASSCEYGTIQAAIDDAATVSGDIITLNSNVTITTEINVNKAITIDGNGNTLFATFAKNGNLDNAAIGILHSDVTIKNLVEDGTGSTSLHGINTYAATNVNLDNVTISHNGHAGLVVNGSTVTASTLSTSNNGWGAVNVDPGSGVTTASVFTLSSGTLAEATQIWSDGSNVSGSATVTVNASGYSMYKVGGTTAGYLWSNRTLTNAAQSLKSNITTLYTTIQDAVNAAASGDTINVGAGSYAENVTITKPLTLKGAQVGVDARNRSGSESVVSSVSVSSGNVTVDGFSFNGNSSQVNVSSATTLSGVVVQNDIFGGYGSVALPTYDAGNIVIQKDRFNGPAASGEAIQIKASSVQGGCNGSQVLSNTFDAATNNGGSDVNLSCTDSNSTGVTISGNTTTGNSGGSSFVAFSGVNGGISVTGNVGTTTGSTVFFFGNVSGSAAVTGNTFTGGGSSAVSIHGADITSDTANTGTFTITDNTLTGNVRGLYVASTALGSGAHVTVAGNNLSGNSTAGVQNDSAVSVNAASNWWGTITGPGTITGVNTTPWCTASSCATLSNNADLTSLSLSSGSLSPAFSSSTTSYAANVDNSVTSITVSDTANPGSVAVVSGGTSLAVGSNTVTVAVTSADGTVTKTYTVTVNRASPPAPPPTTTPPTTTPTTVPPVVSLPPGAPPAAYGSPVTATTQTGVTTSIVSTQASGVSASVSVPAGALPAGTAVAVSPVTNVAALSSFVPSGQSYVVSFAVSWKAPGGGSPTASAPITISITDPAIKAGDVIYEITPSGLQAVGKAAQNGSVTITFSTDPAFIVTAAPKLVLTTVRGQISAKGVQVKLACTSGAVCSGTVQLSVARVKVQGRKKVTTHLVLASAHYSVKAGSRTTLNLRFTATGKSVLAHRPALNHFKMTLLTNITNGPRYVAPVVGKK